MFEWILRRVREEETVVMMRMFPPPWRGRITCIRRMLEWILRRVREEETVVMMRMFPPPWRGRITCIRRMLEWIMGRVREEETVVMMMMFLPFMGSKNHLYKEDVGVDHAETEGGGDGGDDYDVPPLHGE
jgi:hypothetical protein